MHNDQFYWAVVYALDTARPSSSARPRQYRRGQVRGMEVRAGARRASSPPKRGHGHEAPPQRRCLDQLGVRDETDPRRTSAGKEERKTDRSHYCGDRLQVFERFPHRRFRMRLPGQAELDQERHCSGRQVGAAAARLSVFRGLLPGSARHPVQVLTQVRIGCKFDDPDLPENEVAEIWEGAVTRSPESRGSVALDRGGPLMTDVSVILPEASGNGHDHQPLAPQPDHDAIRHPRPDAAHAGEASGVEGILTLTRIDARTETSTPSGSRSAMSSRWRTPSSAGRRIPNLNLYSPFVIFRKDLPADAKGGEADVRAVLAFVGDLDSDKGKTVDRARRPAAAAALRDREFGRQLPAVLAAGEGADGRGRQADRGAP